MSVLIKGLTMPKNSYEVKTIAIRPDGTWYEMTIRGNYDYESGEAVEVPTPHGRLIDADAEIKKIEAIKEKVETDRGCIDVYDGEIACLTLASTIIEAEVEE